MSLKFLGLKSFHPASQANQKRVWIAEQEAKAKAQREAEAAAEVRKAADAQRFQQLAAANGDVEAARRLDAQQVGFLYAPPPGLAEAKDNAKERKGEEEVHLVAEDDAAREFRKKIEKSKGNAGAEDARRNLERYVGRRPDEPLTIKDQVERFPFLKDAPVEGACADSVKVNFKPVGKQLRNVRCLRCGQWGHQSGDRECELRDFNPHDAARQVMEDPMTLVKKHNAAAKNQLVLKQTALPLEMQGGDADEFSILPSEDEDGSDPERAFLARLSSKEKKRLLKKLKKQQETDSSSSSDSDSSDDSHRRRSKSKSKRKHKRKKDRKKSSSRHHHSYRESSDVETHAEDREDRRRHRHRNEERNRKTEKLSSSKRRRSRSRSRSNPRDSTRRHRDS